MVKTCDMCCFAHKCGGDCICEYYCSTLSFAELDDEEYIENGRKEYRKEWFAYTASLCEE